MKQSILLTIFRLPSVYTFYNVQVVSGFLRYRNMTEASFQFLYKRCNYTARVGDDGDSLHDCFVGRNRVCSAAEYSAVISVIITGLIQNTDRVITVITRN